MREMYLAIFLLFLFVGCNSENNREDNQTTYPSFIVHGDLDKCSCFPITSYLARGELGIVPTTLLDTGSRPEFLKSQLSSDATHETFQIVSVNDCIDSLRKGEAGPAPMRVMVHQSGHLYGLLGTIDIDGVRLYQLIHGDSQVWLASREQLARATADA